MPRWKCTGPLFTWAISVIVAISLLSACDSLEINTPTPAYWHHHQNPSINVNCPASVTENAAATCALEARHNDLFAHHLTCSLNSSTTCTGVTLTGCTSANVPAQGEASGPGSCSVVVDVTDDHHPPRSGQGSDSITITEENQSPVWTTTPTDLVLIPEQSYNNNAFAQAVDTDLPNALPSDPGHLICSISDQTCTFDIAVTGEGNGLVECSISFIASVHAQTCKLRVQVADNGSPAASTGTTITISVVGVWTWMSGSNALNESGVFGTKGVPDPANVPGARSDAVSCTDATGNLWLFGGNGYSENGSPGFLNDLWRWDGSNWTWMSGENAVNQGGVYGTKEVPDPANVPGARRNAVSWNDAYGNLWLFGGSGYVTSAGWNFLNDLWRWDGVNWTWMSGSNATNQLGVYGTKGVPAPANVPGARENAVSWTDASGNLWLFGGRNEVSGSYGYLNDLWRWDGANWTWISGSNARNQLGVYGTKGIPGPANVPGARYRAVSWTDDSGNLWLFGGNGCPESGGGGYLNDLWRWDGVNWTWMGGSKARSQLGVYGTKGVPAPANVPGARYSAVSWTDASGNLWLFGGYGYAASGGTGHLNDLWKWDGANWTWMSGSNTIDQYGVYGTKGVPDPANVPGARSGAVSWTDATGNFWLFGGMGYSTSGDYDPLNDLWRWDGANWTWISGNSVMNLYGLYGTKGVPDPANVPGARYRAVSWTDATGNFWLFGGNGFAANGSWGYLNDLWKWDGANWAWMSGSNIGDQYGVYGTKGVPAPANVPGARESAVSWTDASGNFWLFGGSGYPASGGTGQLNDLWRWDGANWTWMSGSNAIKQLGVYGTKGVPALANIPGARSEAISWTDTTGNFWLFGGSGYPRSGGGGFLNDLWRWDGVNWTWISGSNTINQLGVYGSKGMPDPANVPGARFYAISWTDATGNLWLFGGLGMVPFAFNDLWRWDGANWTWISGSNTIRQSGVYGTKGVPDPANVPGARGGAVSWTDDSGNFWLFGGSDFDDLWRWDGANWTWMSGSNGTGQYGVYGTKGVPDLANVPGARSEAISWTDASGNFWLFGGSRLNDLWRYNF